MGQGQADLAIQMLKECARNGDWLCLKNLHLVVSWLPVLEKVDSDKHTNTSAISFSNHEGASVFKYHALLNDFLKISI
jgi:hypothetical protein